jgi:hypothetical protein
MRKVIAILLLVAVLALTLTACSTEKDVYQNDVGETADDSSLDELVTADVTTDDLGGEDFIELGDMI